MVSVSSVRTLWKLRFLLDGTTRIYQGRLSLPLFSRLVPRLRPFSSHWREIDIIFKQRGGDYQRREGGRGRWHRGGSGVLQREIPSITP